MGVNGKKKGNKGELALTKWWTQWSGFEFSRVPQSGGLRWQKQDDICGDIIITDERQSRRFPFSIESKSYKDINFEQMILGQKKNMVMGFWEQCKTDAERSKKYPILFMRYNGMKANTWFTVLRYEEFKYVDKKLIDNPYFDIKGKDERIIIINSSDLIKTDYHKFIKQLKIKRNGEKRK